MDEKTSFGFFSRTHLKTSRTHLILPTWNVWDWYSSQFLPINSKWGCGVVLWNGNLDEILQVKICITKI